MRKQLKTTLYGLVERNIQGLAKLTSAGITVAGLMLLAIIAYAGTAANKGAADRERTLLQNALNRGIARILNEQKGVAWWDDAVTKIDNAHVDYSFADSEFGIFLTETYGQDEVYILNRENKPLYVYTEGARAGPGAFAARRETLAAVVNEARKTLKP
jgi:sensor domain CHASE-containing protein